MQREPTAVKVNGNLEVLAIAEPAGAEANKAPASAADTENRQS
jgi:hypothetical protein